MSGVVRRSSVTAACVAALLRSLHGSICNARASPNGKSRVVARKSNSVKSAVVAHDRPNAGLHDRWCGRDPCPGAPWVAPPWEARGRRQRRRRPCPCVPWRGGKWLVLRCVGGRSAGPDGTSVLEVIRGTHRPTAATSVALRRRVLVHVQGDRELPLDPVLGALAKRRVARPSPARR